MNQIDGEYAALGRNTRETGLFLTQFGTQQNNGFSVSGSGVQENEFSDGFRMSVRATQPMLINSNVINGISSTMLSALPPGTQSVSKWAPVWTLHCLLIRYRQLPLQSQHQSGRCRLQYQSYDRCCTDTKYVHTAAS